MTKKRLFLAINLPEKIKDKIEKILEKIRFDFSNDIRFLDRKNWHLTIVFLGYQPSEAFKPILEAMKNVASNFDPPKIELTDIAYGPKGAAPRMIWLNGSLATANSLGSLKTNLEAGLEEGGVRFKKEHRRFQAHITLARFRSVKVAELPPLAEKFQEKFQANNLDLMESHLARSGANYEILQRFLFQLK